MSERGGPVDAARLRQITATGEDVYEVSFDGAPETMTFTVVEIRGIRGANPHPDLFMSGRFGDPRPIVRAVLAVHDARRGEALA